MSQGFDLAVTKREPKTGRVLSVDDYIMTIDKDGTRFERPPHSGMFYDASGKCIKDSSAEREKLAKEKSEADGLKEKERLDADHAALKAKLKLELEEELTDKIRAKDAELEAKGIPVVKNTAPTDKKFL